jgi:two-component system alkaline phosphatase synthesis response regulator PhoP
LGAQSQENSNYIEIGDLIIDKDNFKVSKGKEEFLLPKSLTCFILLLILTKFSKEKKSLKKFGEMM